MSQAVNQDEDTREWSLQLVSDTELTTQNYPIPADKTCILGRDPDVDLVIPLGVISRQHAELQITRGRLRIRDLGSINGTYLNDQKIAEELARPGDRIRFENVCFELQGPSTLTLAATTISPALTDEHLLAATQAMASTQIMTIVPGLLVGLSQPVKGQEFPLSGLKQTIGRDKSNDIVIEHASVSSRHAEMTYLDGEWLVRDLQSTNGTFIDGQQIDKGTLKPGQQLSLAGVCLEYRLHNEASTGFSTGVHNKVTRVKAIKRRRITPLMATGLLAVCALLLMLFPPAWLQPLLPQHKALHEVRGQVGNIVDDLTEDPVLPPLTLSPTWAPLALPSNRGINSPTLMDLNDDQLPDIVMTDARGYVSAVDGQSGRSLLSTRLASKIIAPPAALSLAGQPAIVVARYDGRVDALNRAGQSLWLSDAGLELGKLVQRPLILDVNNDQQDDIIVATERKGLAALDGSRKGWLLWHTEHLQRGRLSALPLAADINSDGLLDFVTVSDQGQVLAITLDQGVPRKLWEQQLAPILFAAPTLVSNRDKPQRRQLVVVATHQGELLALSGKTGALVWQTPQPKALFASPLSGDITGDGNIELVTISHDGEIIAYRGGNGERLWQQQLGAQVQGSPLLFDIDRDGGGDLVILDSDGTVHLLGGRDGAALIDSLQPEGVDSFIASPLLGDINGDRRSDLIAISQNGLITSLTLNRRLALGSAPWPQLLGNDVHSYSR